MMEEPNKKGFHLGLLIVFSIFLFMGSALGPLFLIFTFFVPVPLVMACLYYGIRKLLFSGIFICAIIYFITGSTIFSQMYVMFLLIPAMVASYAILKNYDAITAITGGFLALCTGLGFFFKTLTIALKEEFISNFSLFFSYTSITLKSQGISEVEINRMFQQLRDSMPLGLMLFLFVVAALNYYIIQILSKQTGYLVPEMKSLDEIRCGVIFCIFFIIAVSLNGISGNALIAGFDPERVRVASANMMLLCRIGFFINAISFILWIIESRTNSSGSIKNNFITALLLAVLLIYIKYLTGFLIIFGIIDAIMDFRSINFFNQKNMSGN